MHTNSGVNMAALKRIANELPSLVALALIVAGVDQTDYAPVVEFAGAVGTFGTWLLARRKIDGPVTVAESGSLDNEDGHGPPDLLWLVAFVILIVVLVRVI